VHGTARTRSIGGLVTDTPKPPEALPLPESDDEPSVMGAGCGVAPMPTREEAEAAWRQAYVDRMVARGADREDAQMACDAIDAELSEDPADMADDDLEYWDAD